MLVARPYQSQTVNAIFKYMLHSKGKPGNPLIAWPTGCHAKGTGILLFDGSIRAVEDIKVGDLLMGPDSRPREVISLAQGNEQMVKVSPVKGVPFVVNVSHILSLKRTAESANSSRRPNAGDINNITVRDYMAGTKWFRHVRKLWRVGVEFNNFDALPLPAYFIGMHLGDGGYSKDTVNFTSQDSELAEYWKSIIEGAGDLHREVVREGNNSIMYFARRDRAIPGQSAKVATALKGLGLHKLNSGTKIIPAIYKTASRDDRLQLLAGLIDTDGSLSSGAYDYITKSKVLADDIAYVCRSLGFAAYITEKTGVSQHGTIGIYYRLSISGDISEIPVKLQYKRASPRLQKKDVLITGFSTELLPPADFYGFELSGDHLYLTSDFTVHHNTGKAFGICLFIKQLFEKWPQMRVIISAPSEELVEQNFLELKGFWPAAPAGIYCASLKRYETHFPITFGTIDSIDGNCDKFGRIDILIPDECHRISSKEDSRYHRVYNSFKDKNKHFFMLGWTATDYRMGQGKLTDEGGLFSEVLYDATTLDAFNWFFSEGYLVPPIAAPTTASVSGEKMGMLGGDFKQSDLQDAFERDRESGAIERALRESVAVARDENRTSWICFVPGIAACEEVAEMLDSMGVTATFVHSKIPRKERRQRLKDYKAGKYTCIINNGILTTGFNHKALDFMIMLRKTASASLWVQMLGRGTRPYYAEGFDLSTFDGRWQAIRANGKLNFRVMDFVGNTERLGPINDPVKPKKPGEKKEGTQPIKICKVDESDSHGIFGCGMYNHPSVRNCFYCDWEFPVKPTIDSTASTAELVRQKKKDDSPQLEWFDVDKVTYKSNYRTSKPTIIATYYCAKKKFDEWVCLEHSGYARKRAEQWWSDRSGGEKAPNQIMQAMPLIDSLRVPRKVLVWTNTKPVEVRDYEY